MVPADVHCHNTNSQKATCSLQLPPGRRLGYAQCGWSQLLCTAITPISRRLPVLYSCQQVSSLETLRRIPAAVHGHKSQFLESYLFLRDYLQVGGFDAQCDWSQLLSSGEQQRVAILRLLAHAPQLAFLDECTSAVDGHLGEQAAALHVFFHSLAKLPLLVVYLAKLPFDLFLMQCSPHVFDPFAKPPSRFIPCVSW